MTSANVLNGLADGARTVRRCADQHHRVEVLLGVERKLLQEGINCMGVEHDSQLLPSGGDFATSAAPTLPEAPGLFSMMMVVLSAVVARVAQFVRLDRPAAGWK